MRISSVLIHIVCIYVFINQYVYKELIFSECTMKFPPHYKSYVDKIYLRNYFYEINLTLLHFQLEHSCTYVLRAAFPIWKFLGKYNPTSLCGSPSYNFLATFFASEEKLLLGIVILSYFYYTYTIIVVFFIFWGCGAF